jgi:hypothetical protein
VAQKDSASCPPPSQDQDQAHHPIGKHSGKHWNQIRGYIVKNSRYSRTVENESRLRQEPGRFLLFGFVGKCLLRWEWGITRMPHSSYG